MVRHDPPKYSYIYPERARSLWYRSCFANNFWPPSLCFISTVPRIPWAFENQFIQCYEVLWIHNIDAICNADILFFHIDSQIICFQIENESICFANLVILNKQFQNCNTFLASRSKCIIKDDKYSKCSSKLLTFLHHRLHFVLR